jgi:pyrimidine-nucleoside phosphorylase
MELLPSELIRKKRFGGAHTHEEIRFFIQGYAQDKIPDYQMSAWIMAICFTGMTSEEIAWLTQEMRDSGVVLDLSHLGTTVDKHSTGGIGDKTSLLLAPIVAATGLTVPMMAGRGLAHTGGTLDKLESVPGFNVRLTFEAFKKQLSSIGCAIMGQTLEMCPADRKLYALRDVTGTVDSLPLICGSIMSKKLAEGLSALILDVKAGSGAFMKSAEDAENLARALIDIGVRSGKKVHALITRMDEPLGRFVGNALEVKECLDLLNGKISSGEGKTYQDTLDLSLELAAHMILLGGKVKSVDEGRKLAKKALDDGSAKRKFYEMCEWQGGKLNQGLPQAQYTEEVTAESDGYVRYVNLEKMGLACVHLGAGRAFQNDVLDFSAGIEVFREQNSPVKKGQTIFKVYHSDYGRFKQALPVLNECFTIAGAPIERTPLVLKEIT